MVLTPTSIDYVEVKLSFSSVRFILLFCHKQQITSFVNVKKITFAFILTVKTCTV